MSQALLREKAQPISAPAFTGKRVLYILPQPFFLTRGSSFRALATIRGLAALGLQVDVVAYPLGDKIDVEGVSMLRSLGLPGIRQVPIGPSLRKLALDSLLLTRCTALALRRRYDILHGVEEGGIIAALLAKAKGIPYIFDMHSWMSVQLEDAGFNRPRFLLNTFRALERSCIRRASAVITVGTALTDKAASIAPAVAGFTLEDYALDVSTFDESAKENLRQQFGLKGKVIFLYTGNFEPYQGLDLLFKGFSEFIKDNPELSERVTLLLVGGGDTGSREVSTYRELARELGVLRQTVFAGQRGLSEMGLFMDIADVLVSPRAQGENTPLKIYSYMAAAKIIVATRIRSHTQVLSDDTAILADPTPSTLAQALFQAIDPRPQMTALRQACLRKAKEDVEVRFSEREFFKRITSCYERVFSNYPQR